MGQLQSKYIQLSQLTLHYLQAAPTANSDNKTIVFLHGFPQFSGAWSAQIQYFSEKFRVIAPDLPGYNLSDKPEAPEFYQVPNLISVMAEFLAKINNNNPVYLVAHDWGGALAWPLCAFYPDLVEKLIILNAAHPSTFTREILSNPLQQQKSEYIKDLIATNGNNMVRNNDFQFLKEMIDRDTKRFPLSAQQLEEHCQSWQQPHAIECMLQYYQNMPLHQSSAKKAHIPNIQINRPTLVLWGMDDTAFCPELLDGLEEYVADLSLMKLADASHWLHHEIPEQVNQHIAEFIDSD